MKKIEKFVADDGKEFLTEVDCLRYEEKIKVPQMKPINEINWTEMLDYANQYIELVQKTEEFDEDLPQYIFESLIETVYGKGVWTWVNNINR